MAVCQIDYFSRALERTVMCHMVLPNDVMDYYREENPHFNRPMKTLVLLHGYFGSSTEWLYKSDIVELSSRYNVCVILPSGENSFYTEGTASGRQYQTYISELLNYARDTFHLSKRKEDTFIGGFSMGGFGALLTGLTDPGTYEKVFLFSAALITDEVATFDEHDHQMANGDYYRLVFGELSEVKASKHHPLHLLKQPQTNNAHIPSLFVACGTEDWLINHTRRFIDELKDSHVSVTYYEEAGGHDFRFWNKMIEPAIQWCLEE
ncbi:tributyrin esterase [Halolactibacillus miurensis]|uniref:S-formylglutathione hydrolase FrmB n=1 Tax=Halolactibacillus miurensis TaxID=306541 RepID=A0A1I6ST26_9BACI|nr:alpha/beta hydrolase-fold protein [Halolactibacillus miurensis]GEM04218.1 tributyrin esterase [Halolactibacillus miurensis]SFS80095.1 S-formylglutathione hydrolase FrmB [Halolactibacillus miurensis]